MALIVVSLGALLISPNSPKFSPGLNLATSTNHSTLFSFSLND